MFGLFDKNEEPDLLDDPIVRVLTEMGEYSPDEEKYSELLSHLERLHELKTGKRRERVSQDTLAIVAGNLLGILLIVGYEHAHVVTSKGLNFILKPKHQ